MLKTLNSMFSTSSKADNEGSLSCFCIKGRGTRMPCRMCEVLRNEILLFDTGDVVPRNAEVNDELLHYALPAYCRQLKGQRLTANEKRLLEWCKGNSLIPVRPALFNLPKPFPTFNIYSMGAYDLMHTIAGLLENYVSTAAVCVVEVGKYPGYKDRYYDNIGRLDMKIAHMPLKHGVPLNMRQFKEGISGIVGLRRTENTDRTRGGGSLGLIDSQDVPQLVLQMILSKFKTRTFKVQNLVISCCENMYY